MTEPNHHAVQSIYTWQWALGDLCKELDRISSRSSSLGRFIERSVIPETDLEINEYDRSCPICQVPYYHERPVQLPCGHIFGHRCATQWLKQAKTCPMCRKLVRPREKLSYKLSILHPDRLGTFRHFLLFVIQRYGVAKGASLDRDFQALIRSRPRAPPEIDFSTTKAPLWHDICWRRLHNWERKWNEINASILPKRLNDPYFENSSPYRTFGVAKGGVIFPHERSSWFSEFGIKSDSEAWQTLRCRRMLHWLRGPWDGYELEFLTMAASQITDYDVEFFSKHRAAIDFSWHDNPSSPWRLMDSRDFLEYRPNSGSTCSPALATWLDTLSTD